MRKLSILLAVVLLALAALALAPDAALAPYAETAHTVLPGAIAGVAFLLLLVLLADRPKDRLIAEPPAPIAAAPVELPVAAPPTNQCDAEVVNFLATLQEKGRFVDFLMDDIARYSDAQVGAAGRVLHEGCRAVLLEHFGIRPMREEGEGSTVVVAPGYAADDYRLVGRIAGEPPFTGTLIHHGWKAEWVKLPRLVRMRGDQPPAIAPAEVELG